MTRTSDNLGMAFAGESQANRRYLAFAKKADEEGFKQIAKLFRAAAEADTVHALSHLKVMGAVKGTQENVKAAISGETHEFMKMYPEMINAAGKEGSKDAAMSFRRANEVEKIHAALYEKALSSLSSGKDMEKKNVFVCQVCGNTFEGETPENCPICGVARSMFKKIE